MANKRDMEIMRERGIRKGKVIFVLDAHIGMFPYKYLNSLGFGFKPNGFSYLIPMGYVGGL